MGCIIRSPGKVRFPRKAGEASRGEAVWPTALSLSVPPHWAGAVCLSGDHLQGARAPSTQHHSKLSEQGDGWRASPCRIPACRDNSSRTRRGAPTLMCWAAFGASAWTLTSLDAGWSGWRAVKKHRGVTVSSVRELRPHTSDVQMRGWSSDFALVHFCIDWKRKINCKNIFYFPEDFVPVELWYFLSHSVFKPPTLFTLSISVTWL